MEQDYEKKSAEKDFDQIVEIESNCITLDIPDDGITTKEGWEILPLCPPVVRSFQITWYAYVFF